MVNAVRSGDDPQPIVSQRFQEITVAGAAKAFLITAGFP
jgi:hypothetical protein